MEILSKGYEIDSERQPDVIIESITSIMASAQHLQFTKLANSAYLHELKSSIVDTIKLLHADKDSLQIEASRIAELACNYCLALDKENDVMPNIIAEINDPYWAYQYCLKVNNNPKVRQVIIDSGDFKIAYQYCRYVDNDEQVRQVFTSCKKPTFEQIYWLLEYCKHVSNSDEVRQMIVDSKNPQWAFNYCCHVYDDSDMQQVIVDAKDPKWAYEHHKHLGYNHKIHSIIMQFGDAILQEKANSDNYY